MIRFESSDRNFEDLLIKSRSNEEELKGENKKQKIKEDYQEKNILFKCYQNKIHREGLADSFEINFNFTFEKNIALGRQARQRYRDMPENENVKLLQIKV